MAEPLQTVTPPSRDAQAEAPATRVSLSRVGVVGVEKIIRVCASQNGGDSSDESLYHADLECFVDLNPEQAGVHMSRFEEVVNEAIDTVVLGESLRAEGLAAHIAEQVRERQGGIRRCRDRHRPVRAHGVVAHRTGHRPPARDRHAHPG